MKTCGNISFALNYDQNSCILVACDNTCRMELADEMYLLTFFFHTIPFVFATNLSHATKRILVAKTSKKIHVFFLMLPCQLFPI
jgi:hypothetical protein